MDEKRQIIYFRHYYWDFFNSQTEKTKDKIDYVLFLVSVAEKTPKREIEKAMKIMKEYWDYKKKGDKK